jgi:hypothetical protein
MTPLTDLHRIWMKSSDDVLTTELGWEQLSEALRRAVTS